MKRLLPLLTILALAFSLLPPAPARAQEAPEALPAFGYAWETGLTFSEHWVDIHTTGTAAYFSSNDDGVTYVAVPIGFDFKYFENTYTSLYLSTNGLISFERLNNAFPANRQLPVDEAPNNIIAPFWDDLKVKDDETNPNGAVYYQTIGNTLVIEYYSVTRFGDLAGATLTFEVILHANGDIVFAYKELNSTLDSATVGFEDDQGVDGLQHIYNQAGMANQQAMRAVYPADGSRLKAYPRYASGFAENYQVVLPFTVRNTGTVIEGYTFGAYSLAGDNTWIASFENAAGQPIGSIISLQPGQSFAMQVRLRAPSGSPVGNYFRARVRVTAASSKYFDIFVQGAIAAPFSQTFIDSGDGYAEFITPTRRNNRKIFDTYTGATLNLMHISDMDYLLAWEVAESQPQFYININTVEFSATENNILTSLPLQDHASDPFSINDSYPSMVQSPGGQIGVTFLRNRQEGLTQQTNIFFGLLDSRGSLIADPLNLTGNEDWQPLERYRNPTLLATGDNQFIVAWEKITPNGPSDQFRDIEIAVLNASGQLTYGPIAITNSQLNARDYFYPSLTYLTSNKVAVGLFIQPDNGQISLGYALRQTNGSPAVGGLIELGGYTSEDTGNLTTAPLAAGNWMLAWVDGRQEKVLYAILDDSGGVIANPAQLVSLDQRTPEDIGSTFDENGNVILTWRDIASDYLYYVLFGPNGSLLTPAMSFRRGSDPANPNIFSTSTGGGLSTCPEILIWTTRLPVIRR